MELAQRQQQSLSFQMLQSMKLLQMGMQELQEYVEESIQENPVLELPEPAAAEAEARELSRRLEWLRANDRQNAYYHAADADDERGDLLSNAGHIEDEDHDLKRYLLSQFFGMSLEPELMAALNYLVERLDDDGLLDEDEETLSRQSGLSPRVIARAVIELQSAEPAGVGARSIQECLRLQLERRAGDHRLAMRIVEEYLEDLGHDRYGRISRALGVSEREVRASGDLIRTLNPHPGSGFASSHNLSYIIPDVLVTGTGGSLAVTVNDMGVPRLNICSYYLDLLNTTDDPGVRQYLTDKLGQAKWLIQSLQQRKSTLERCAEWIVRYQDAFFRRGAAYLLPLTMVEAAKELGIHESTVSRTVRDKYLQCTRGIYPLSYFFSHAIGTGEVSAEATRSLLRSLVDTEPPDRPLSDQKLCEELARQGCQVSRRTVAKYRDELGIPSAAGRRQRNDNAAGRQRNG